MAQGLQQDPGGWHLRGVKDDGKTEGSELSGYTDLGVLLLPVVKSQPECWC